MHSILPILQIPKIPYNPDSKKQNAAGLHHAGHLLPRQPRHTGLDPVSTKPCLNTGPTLQIPKLTTTRFPKILF